MNNISVNWGSTIQWASFYRRNNKTGAIKNVQCFPNHFNGDAGFCGQSIIITVICNKALVPNLHVMGEFCLEENAVKRYPVGSRLTIEEYELNKKNHTFFTGVLDKQEMDDQMVKCTYEINRELRGWHYGWTASKHRQDIDHVFIIHVFNFNQSGYDSIGILYSPSFQIRCSRRVTTLIESRNTPKAFKKMIPQPYNPNEKYNQFIPHNKDIKDNKECLYDGLNRDNHDEPSMRYSIPLTHVNINEISLPPTTTTTVSMKKNNNTNTGNTNTGNTNTGNTGSTTGSNINIKNIGNNINVKKKLNQKRKMDKNNSLLVYASQNNHKKKMRVLKPPPLVSFTSLSQQSSPLETAHKIPLDIKSEPTSPITLPPPTQPLNIQNNNNDINNISFLNDYFNNNNNNNNMIRSSLSSLLFSPSNDNIISPINPIYNNNFIIGSNSGNSSSFISRLSIDVDDLTQPPPPPPPPVSLPLSPTFQSIQQQGQQQQPLQFPSISSSLSPSPSPSPQQQQQQPPVSTTPPPFLHSLHSPPPLSLVPPPLASPAIEPSLIYDGPVLSDQYTDSHSFVPLPPPASPLTHSPYSVSSITSSNSDDNESGRGSGELIEGDTVFQSAFFTNENNNNNNNNNNDSNNDNLDWNSFELNGDYEESRFIFSPSSFSSPHIEFFDSQFLQSTPPTTPTPKREAKQKSLSSSSSSLLKPTTTTTTTSSFRLSSSSSSSRLNQRKPPEDDRLIFRFLLFVFVSTLIDSLIVLLLKSLLEYFDYKLQVLFKHHCLYLLVLMIIIGIIKRCLIK